MPLATLQDLTELEKVKSCFVGATNILIPSVPTMKPDLVINLDDNFFDYKQTPLVKLCKIHSPFEKDFINNLTKWVKNMNHNLAKGEEFWWEAIPMS